jgi:hypothetical protein
VDFLFVFIKFSYNQVDTEMTFFRPLYPRSQLETLSVIEVSVSVCDYPTQMRTQNFSLLEVGGGGLILRLYIIYV